MFLSFLVEDFFDFLASDHRMEFLSLSLDHPLNLK